MNFVGKFDAKLHIDGSDAHPDARLHVDSVTTHAPSDAVIVPDADLLFHGDFKRSGVDLILSRDDHEWVVQDYFKGERHATLASPDGARLTGDIVNALAGHVEVAQADGSAGAGKVIGHVTKLVGTATAVRNGVSIILNQGDNVEKGDVVQSGSGSTLGVTFIDGTVFGLSSNARMVLNEMVYDPNGSNNSALISLVAGTISFVAGQTAKHGDMKIDTPVATMGIRGTAVLVEIDFDVPGQNGLPEAKFQVLMEPDGTTGSYILFDKNTLAPIAVVDKAGQQVDISNGNVSFTNSPLSPELQKLITDVFTLKFTNATPQTFTHFSDTLIPQQTWLPVQLANSGPPVVVHLTITPIIAASGPSFSAPSGSPIPHLNVPPVVITADKSLIEHAGVTGSSAIDTTSGTISFADINLGDRPTATATFSSFTYQNAQHQTIAPNAQELADIQALEVPLLVVQTPGNTANGSATWTYNVLDKAFDFLGAGETLTLTYMAEVDSNYAAGNLATLVPFTITITGTNDAPVITTGPEKVAFVNVGTTTPGPNLPPTPAHPTTNKLTFKDPDLTDTHTVSTDLTNATLSETTPSGKVVLVLDMQALENNFPRPMGVFESALSAAVTTDSTGTGTGTITWTLADIAAYYADIVPAGETLTLTYTVTVKDSQGATSSQNVTVTITGSEPPAVVWVETTAEAATDTAPGDWNGAHNWETGTVPTASDDVIIITNQLQGQTPFYPVTIKATADGGVAAYAHSLTMNDYGTLFTNSPTLINHNTLTVGAGGISLSADAILENFGTLSLGGLLEVLQESSLQNNVGGLITLLDGGDFNDSGSFTDSNGAVHTGSVTNSGTIDVAGGTLNVEVAVANSGGTIEIDPGATLKLNGAEIIGGSINDNNKIDVTGSSKIDGGATLNNGAVTVEDDVTLTLDGMTVNGTTITDKGTIVLGDTVQLTGSATLEGTSSSALGIITNNGTLEVAGAAELLDDTLTNTSGIIQVDALQTLTLNGTEIIGGTVNDNGKIDVTGSSKIDGGATLNNGAATVEPGVTLTLDGMTANGTTITDKGTVVIGDTVKLTGNATLEGVSGLALGAITNNGTLEVAGAAELLNDTVTNTGATLQVDDGVTLKLNGTTIDGGTINDFSSTAGGKIDVTGASTIAGTGTAAEADLNGNGTGTVTLDAALTLDYVKLNGVTIENGTTPPGLLTIQDTVEVAGAVTLLNDTVTNTGATLRVDDGITLKLDGTTIDGGTINDFSSTAGGKIDVTGASTIAGTAAEADLNGNGTGTVMLDAALTLDDVKLSGITIENGTTPPGLLTIQDTVEVAGAVTLLNDTVTNTGATLRVDDGITLKLNGTTIDGGTIDDFSSTAGGKIDVTGASTIAGTGTAAEADLNGNGTGTVTLDAALTLDYVKLNGVTIENGTTPPGLLTIQDTVEVAGAVTPLNDTVTNTGATLRVDDGITLKLDGTTIDGGTINDFSSTAGGKIDVTGASTIAGTSTADANLNGNGTGTVMLDAALTLDYVKLNGVTIENGTTPPGLLTIQDTVEVAGAVTLLNDTVTNTGATLQVDDGVTLKLNGTTIDGGTIDDFSSTAGGKIDVTGNSKIDGGATLNNGAVTVEDTVTLTLDGMTVNGTTITDKGTIVLDHTVKLTGSATLEGTSSAALGIITNNGTLEVAGAAELLNDTLTNTSGIVQVDALQTLTLNGTEIIGGTVNDNGKIDVTGSSKIDGGATLNNGFVTVEDDVTLTLDGMTANGTTITDKGTVVIGDTVKLTGNATLEGVSGLALGAITNNGTLKVTGAAELLDDTLTNTSGIIQVDALQTLTLSGTEIIGGTITDNGKIDVTGDSKIDGGATLNNGAVTVEDNVTLTLDGMTANGTTITDKGTVVIGDTVKLTGNATLEGVSGLALGAITNNGTLEVAGAAELLDDMLTNTSGIIQVDALQTLTLSGTEIIGGTITDNGKIDVTGDSKIDGGATLNNGAVTVEGDVTLTLDSMTVNGTVFNDLVTGGTIQIESGDTLTFNGATIDGGTLNIVGELDSTGISFITGATIINSSHIDVISGTLTIDPAPVTNTGTIEVKGDSTLVLSDEILTNTDGTTKGVIQVDADPTHTATLDLEGSTINGGTVTIAGVLVSTGDSFITDATITNTGTIDVTGGTLTIDATSILDNTGGTLETNGGNLIIDAAIGGSLDIKGGAVLELGSSLASAYSKITVTFEPGATGTLKLDHSETFGGTVAGLDDNAIDLVDIAYGSNPTVSYAGDVSGGILSVFVGGVDVSIKLTGDYLGVHWTLADDGSSQHGTDLSEVPGAVAGLDANGNATQGVALTASITDGGKTVSGATYAWQVSDDGGKTWVDANGTNGLSNYTPVEADEGQLLRVALSFVDYSGEPEQSFVSAGVVQESLTDDLVATLNHQTAQQGVTMRVLGVEDGGITVTTGLTYAWQDSSNNGLTWVTVGTHSSYTPGESDEGKLMQLVVTYADASGSESSTYSLGMPNDLSATLDSATAQQGLAIHVTGVKDGGNNVSSGVSYAWQVSSDDGQHWTTVGTHSSFTPIAADAGETLQVIVTYADSEEHESATYSLGTVAPAKEWLGGNHDWQTAGQWATSGVPGSSDNAVVDANGIYTLRIDHGAAAHSLVVNDSGATVEIVGGNTLTLGGNVTIEAGKLQIDSGGTLKDIATSATIAGAFTDNGTIEAAGGKLEVAGAVNSGAGTFKIDAGATLQFDHADTRDVAFAGSGELILKDPAHFSGTISDSGGSMTSADVVDVAGFDTNAMVSYSGTTSGGTVTISEAGHTSVHLKVGANSTNWSIPITDGDGGILIHDPPAPANMAVIPATNPAPATSTIVATGANQILTGHAASDTFAFNFTGVGQTTVTDFHPATDTLQFGSELFANLQAALNATHDDGHGNTVIALDAHDTITLNGIIKAQLNASDFHFV